MKPPRIKITQQMVSGKLSEFQSKTSKLKGGDLIRAYDALSLLADAPHAYQVRRGVRFPKPKVEVVGPVAKVPKSGRVPILTGPSFDSEISTLIVGPVASSLSKSSGATLKTKCPHCQHELSIILT